MIGNTTSARTVSTSRSNGTYLPFERYLPPFERYLPPFERYLRPVRPEVSKGLRSGTVRT